MAKEFGYCSSGCSRPQFDKQIEGINHAFPNAIIIKELYSKTVTDRTELKKLMSQLEQDDTLVVYSMDRLSRNSQELFGYYKELSDRGVNLIFINQPFMNTDLYLSVYNEMISQSPVSEHPVIKNSLEQLLQTQISKVLEKSWEDLQAQRSHMKESYEQAKAQEKQPGAVRTKRYESRKSFMVKELIRKYNQNYDGFMNDVQTMDQIRSEMGTISRNTYYKYKKELMEDEKQFIGFRHYKKDHFMIKYKIKNGPF